MMPLSTPFNPQSIIFRLYCPFLLLVVLLLANSYWSSVQAQPYGNEWIDFSQTYYKIKVGKDALYRIPYATLQSAGLPASASGYHLYRNGEEVPIYITSNEFDSPSDYIEFYGKKNDGSLDTPLYPNPQQQVSPYKSLFSDTAAYFLVWNPAPVEALFSPIANDTSNATTPLPYFIHQQRNITANNYWNGRPISVGSTNYNMPFFDEGEGWVSLPISAPNQQTYNVNTPAIYTAPDAPPAQWTVRIAGTSNDLSAPIDHHIRLSVNASVLADTTFADYTCIIQHFSIPANEMTAPQTQLTIAPLGDMSSSDIVAAAYYQVTYPRLFDFGNQRLFEFSLPNNEAAYLEINNFNGETAPVLYDLTNLKRVIPIVENNTYKVNLTAGDNTNQPRRLLLCNTTSPLSLVTVGQLAERVFTDYSQAVNQGNYLIVSNPKIMAGDTNFVAQYANYRRSTQGGDYVVSVANIEELYDQFAYGVAKHPLAIAHFVNYATDVFDSIPSQLLLLGKATMVSEFGLVTTYNNCLVPTYGVQPSDVLLAARSRNAPLPQLTVGRVPVQNPAELRSYLRKVRDYENVANGPACIDTSILWRRKMICLASENSPEEQIAALNAVRSYADSLAVGYFAADTLGVYGQLGSASTPLPEFTDAINNGVGMVFFAGEQNNNYWRMDVTPPTTYNNAYRYPFIVSQSDFIGNIHSQQPTMANDFVLAAQRGAIGFLDNTTRAIAPLNHQYVSRLVAHLRGTDYEKNIGDALRHTISDLYGSDLGMNLIALTYTFCGDPALSIVPMRKPELLVHESDLGFYTVGTGIPIFGNPAYINSSLSEFEARLQVWSVGKNIDDSCRVHVKRWLPSGEILDILTKRMPFPREQGTASIVIPNNLPDVGINTFIFTVDYGNEIFELCENNNTVSKAADINLYNDVEQVLEATQYHVYPIPAREFLYIETMTNATLNLYDVQGKCVWQTKDSTGKQICPTSSLDAGLYLLHIITKEGATVVKIVVQ